MQDFLHYVIYKAVEGGYQTRASASLCGWRNARRFFIDLKRVNPLRTISLTGELENRAEHYLDYIHENQMSVTITIQKC